MTVGRCQREMGHAEYLKWLDWLDDQWNTPDRTDHYLMQVSANIFQSQSRNPTKIRSDQFRIKFVEANAKPTEFELEQKAEQSRAHWNSFFSGIQKRILNERSRDSKTDRPADRGRQLVSENGARRSGRNQKGPSRVKKS